MVQWIAVAAFVALFISRLLSAAVPPVWLTLAKPKRMVIAGLFVGIGTALSAFVQQHVSWPSAVVQGIAACGAAWGLDLWVPETLGPATVPTPASTAPAAPGGGPAAVTAVAGDRPAPPTGQA